MKTGLAIVTKMSKTEDANQVGKALEMFPLAFALCVADMEASYYMAYLSSCLP